MGILAGTCEFVDDEDVRRPKMATLRPGVYPRVVDPSREIDTRVDTLQDRIHGLYRRTGRSWLSA
jgi:hypothetical protein